MTLFFLTPIFAVSLSLGSLFSEPAAFFERYFFCKVLSSCTRKLLFCFSVFFHVPHLDLPRKNCFNMLFIVNAWSYKNVDFPEPLPSVSRLIMKIRKDDETIVFRWVSIKVLRGKLKTVFFFYGSFDKNGQGIVLCFGFSIFWLDISLHVESSTFTIAVPSETNGQWAKG